MLIVFQLFKWILRNPTSGMEWSESFTGDANTAADAWVEIFSFAKFELVLVKSIIEREVDLQSKSFQLIYIFFIFF
jgi:hypothetical protein